MEKVQKNSVQHTPSSESFQGFVHCSKQFLISRTGMFVKNFSTDLKPSTFEIRFPFSTFLSFGNGLKSVGAKLVEDVGRSVAELPFPAKTAILENNNMPAHCRGEESMNDLSTTLLVCTSRHQQEFSTPPRRMSY
jgi:hypothetical protein